MPDNEFAALRAPLEAVMREAGEVARAIGRRSYKHWIKGGDNSPVTEADLAVNDLLLTRLTALAPAAAWLSEETEKFPDSSMSMRWIVDPIDGTRAFIAGRADWTVSVALVADARPILAALYAPATDEMFSASHGEGATRNGARITVNSGDKLAGAAFGGPKRYLERLTMLEPAIQTPPRVHSLALRLAKVATGELDAAFAAPGSHDWDLAAADLLVHEAGGRLADLSGQMLRYDGPVVAHGALMAAGPARHAALIALLRDRRSEFA